MMEETYQALLELQDLDQKMSEAREQVERFEPQLEEIDAPVEAAQAEVAALRKRVGEMKAEERRLERSSDDKRAQMEKYQARLERVRNPREEAAARTELDLISRALEADEEDALELLDQIKRSELKLDELEKNLVGIEEEANPRRKELLAARDEAESQLQVLADQRENRLIRLSPEAGRLYERVRGGKTRIAMARLMPDGACGHCFSLIPIQEQNQIRRREGLHRCEACGVILYSED